MMAMPPDHPQRAQLTHEVHARPFAAVEAPERISHVAMLSDERGAAADRDHLALLCHRLGAEPPPSGSIHLVRSFPGFRLKWERHTEFCTWTIFQRDTVEPVSFAMPAAAAVPQDWLAALPGLALVKVNLAVTGADPGERLAELFDAETLAGAKVAGGTAEVWTDFRIHGDGFGRILVRDHGLGPRQAGRLVQRLLEIETYRLMALLALPIAREIGPRLSGVDAELAVIMAGLEDLSDLGDERALLGRLVALAAEVERVTALSDFRFGAARAYAALVERRTAELREERVAGQQTLGEFMERRFAPALRTCWAAADRTAAAGDRLARAGTLIRTRVDIALEAQNQALLGSMDRRAQQQLHLQETVEGLSVAAITYYMVGLVGYLAKAGKGLGLPLDAELASGVAIPLVAAAVWLGLRRVRRRLRRA